MSPDVQTFSEQEINQAIADRAFLLALQKARKTRSLDGYFLATGPYRRELYAKHLAFFRAGGEHLPMDSCPPDCDGSPHRERCLLAGNRTGKTKAAGCEFVYHATGLYPDWWEGARFKDPILAWACNDTNKNVRDINQLELLGPANQYGTGLIPSDRIVATKVKAGLPDAIEFVHVKHVSGGTSIIQFKSYEQGWEAFTGAAVHVIWCDEEPPTKVYTECCIRTMTTAGLIMLTFTPLQGTTEVVKGFLESYTKASFSASSEEAADRMNIDTQAELKKNKDPDGKPPQRIDPRVKNQLH